MRHITDYIEDNIFRGAGNYVEAQVEPENRHIPHTYEFHLAHYEGDY